ncbi:MAG: hypothetical protein ACYTG0_38900, partial [Planctomycetota bacterium]
EAHTAQKERKYVTLNEKEFLRQQAELGEDEPEHPQTQDPGQPLIRRDDYLGEVFAITLDYLQRRDPA